jgi:hypothetical protein
MKTTQADADRAAEQVHNVLEGTPALRGYVLVLDFDEKTHVAQGGTDVTQERCLQILQDGVEAAKGRLRVLPTHGIPSRPQ